MQLILGLGNPGSKYANSRHNVGFDAVEACAAFFQVRLRKRCFRLYRQAKVGSSVSLVEPLTYMNKSGEVMRYFPDVKAEEIVVVCDQMDLPPGLIRIRRGGSSAGHNGLKSLISSLGSSNFTRIYIGIGRPDEGVSVVDHVLSRDSSLALQEGIMLASSALQDLISGKSTEEVMLAYNRRNRS
ncbi:aminoacyl-tRNA hydrolase [uncultured Sphaerochaeta sp.]|uniref:aminoacyl-tRNA hydrolase n=1 Tax=uncultured Sphaerochaeta sp. TaxID=886478 RepID=UPI0029CA125E|nr:aminoacyl-tRNA hydrolase [uncultured Sphaerochaeta sp.]